MYSSYLRASIGGIGSGNCGYPQPPTLPAGTAYRPAPTVPGTLAYKNLSESARVQAQQCTTMYISNMPVPVQRGDSNNIPFVEVIPTPASATTASVQNAVLFAQNNPYNPATRFSQYRFADTVIPPGVPCPPKPAPNPAPLIPCVPPLVFRGSVENVGPI